MSTRRVMLFVIAIMVAIFLAGIFIARADAATSGACGTCHRRMRSHANYHGKWRRGWVTIPEYRMPPPIKLETTVGGD